MSEGNNEILKEFKAFRSDICKRLELIESRLTIVNADFKKEISDVKDGLEFVRGYTEKTFDGIDNLLSKIDDGDAELRDLRKKVDAVSSRMNEMEEQTTA